MDRQQALLQLAQQLSAATAASDWTALAAMNTLMAATLPALAAQGAWTAPERAALAALHDLHVAAVAKVDGAAIETGQHLSDMTNNREGWLAYALDSDSAATGT
ncbi:MULTISPECIES: hypothetical protein [unclassified Duganella]|uniref:hypothetical protein n=1 Tax=unclassified Duganella TaxID=2636909 RepID=UPI0007006EB3|nr:MULTISPECIES: hypothetical protein [unclassified Duganella]KQV61707.1 hypothetical protein ASD07_02375 [Duganella sp. Root336D2]KRB84213.1 hypothetical protein ASE26_09040 [Duganella sp. Root198D2]